MYDKYCIPIEYKTNKYLVCDLTDQPEENAALLQRSVYEEANKLIRSSNGKKVLDIGCGSGYKLLEFFNDCDTLGIETEPNYSYLLKKYPNKRWKSDDYTIPLDEHFDLIICSDVLEHTEDPDIIMKYISESSVKFVVFSTPDRELLKYHYLSNYTGEFGPPMNTCHVREWTTSEFLKYVSKWFNIKEWRINVVATELYIMVTLRRL